jgi:hypothetical protein
MKRMETERYPRLATILDHINQHRAWEGWLADRTPMEFVPEVEEIQFNQKEKKMDGQSRPLMAEEKALIDEEGTGMEVAESKDKIYLIRFNRIMAHFDKNAVHIQFEDIACGNARREDIRMILKFIHKCFPGIKPFKPTKKKR